MKSFLKKIIPRFIILFYHRCLARLAVFLYRNPSNKLVVIGVTGTNGKSTVANFISLILAEAGFKVGLTSTYNFRIGQQEWLNNKKMTMLGRLALQRFLARLHKAGCQYAVIETSSEGIMQSRHLGINYDIAVFTNLTPEHIEAHGNFENYKKAKGKLFKHLTQRKRKKINGKIIDKISVVNLDDPHADFFISFPADKKYSYSLKNKSGDQEVKTIRAENVSVKKEGSRFHVGGQEFILPMLGEHNIYNALAALTVGLSQDISLVKAKTALEKVKSLPGRLEFIREGQNFTIIVDYAPEVVSLNKLYEVVKLFDKNKIIHVLGSCGGGRDKARRPILGEIAGQKADLVIVTNEDPYDEDPMAIIDSVAAGAEKTGKIRGQNLFTVLDRREAIKLALQKARAGDLVLLTGKGAEQAICVAGGKKIPWDERTAVKEILSESA
ncbi:MAG: UDP-N-acetylmuramoyl-L-alanyl-D-glutamate--2,6-diaminopimelate ligase [Patescibacteria group bacterium]